VTAAPAEEEGGPHTPGRGAWALAIESGDLDFPRFAETQVHLLGRPLAKAWETKENVPIMEVYLRQLASHPTNGDCKQVMDMRDYLPP
jgi:hypothetical protein